MKEKAIEICRNLKNTISKMPDKTKYQSQSTAYISPSASKISLVKTLNKIMTKYNINLKNL